MCCKEKAPAHGEGVGDTWLKFDDFPKVKSFAIQQIYKLVKIGILAVSNHYELVSHIEVMKCLYWLAIYGYQTSTKIFFDVFDDRYGGFYEFVTRYFGGALLILG